VLRDWGKGDDVLFKRCLKGGLLEVQKIAIEYLQGGVLVVVPPQLMSLPADNLQAEREFAKVSTIDTHSKHPGMIAMEMEVMWQQMIGQSPLVYSEESYEKIRKWASFLHTQKEQDFQHALVQQKKWEEEEEEEEIAAGNKRKREEKMAEELKGVEMIKDPDVLPSMSVEQLRLQLLLHVAANPKKKICYGVAKKEVMLKRFEDLLEKKK
jgi:hypothetical protein